MHAIKVSSFSYCVQVPLEEPEEPAKPEKLAIGVAGGFDLGKPKEKIEEECSLAVLPFGALLPLPCPDLPAQVIESIVSIQVNRLIDKMQKK